MLTVLSRSLFVSAILITQGCGLDNESNDAARAICETYGMTFGTDEYWRCRVAGDQDRKENQIAAFYMLMGVVQEVSNHQAMEVERFRKSLREASSAAPAGSN